MIDGRAIIDPSATLGENADVRAVVLGGQGSVFCAGAVGSMSSSMKGPKEWGKVRKGYI